MNRHTAAPILQAAVMLLALLAMSCGDAAPGSVGGEPSAPTNVTPSSIQPSAARIWNELNWSTPAVMPDRTTILDIIRWRETYVAVGQVSDGGRYVGSAFTSPEGLHWTRATSASTFAAIPTRIIATPTELVAFASVNWSSTLAWSSLDGVRWTSRPDLSLTGALVTVVSYQETIVAVQGGASGQQQLWRAVNGSKWESIAKPSPHAIVRVLSVVGDSIVATGREGQPDVPSGGAGVPAVGRPAAWSSKDAASWAPENVEGRDAPGGELDRVFKTAGGYFATGSDSTDPSQSPRRVLLWTSPDGHDWRLIGPPPHWGRVASNDDTTVVLAPSGPTGFDAWVSRDAKQWTTAISTGDTAHIPGFSLGVGQSSSIDDMFATPRGLIVVGHQSEAGAIWLVEGSYR